MNASKYIVIVKTKQLLIGSFHSPPTDFLVVLSGIEISNGLDTETSVVDIVVTGDLNLNMLNQHS